MRSGSSTVLLLCVLSRLPLVRSFLDYTSESLQRCQLLDSDKGDNNINQYGMHMVDQYMLVIFGLVSLVCSMLVIASFIKYPKSGKQPSDMILCISICDFLLSVHWVSSAIYSFASGGTPPSNNETFCEINSFLSLFSGSAFFTYSIMFCILIVAQIRNSLKGFKVRRSAVHFFVILSSIGFYMYNRFQGNTSVNIYGLCSVRAQDLPWISGILVLAAYIFLSWKTISYFRQYVPDLPAFREERTKFLKFYISYVLVGTIGWSIHTLCFTIVELNCEYQISPIINIFITLGSLSKILTAIALSIARFQDPQLDKARFESVEATVNFLEMTPQVNHNLIEDSSVQSNDSSVGNISDQFNLTQNQRRYSSWAKSITDNLRTLRLQQILAGLSIIGNNSKFLKLKASRVKLSSSIVEVIYTMSEIEQLSEDNCQIPKELILPESSETATMRMKVFFASDFANLRETDAKEADFSNGLDLIKNLKMLETMETIGDGGRSGELLFFNHDNTLLLKTISFQDALSLKRLGKNYFKYVNEENSKTLITKIYGFFSFCRNDTADNKTYLIFMKNLANVPERTILRRYDLKGSKFEREVLAKLKISAKDLVNNQNYQQFHKDSALKKTQLAKLKAEDQSCEENKSNDNAKTLDDEWIDTYNRIEQKEGAADVSKYKVAKMTMKDVDFDKLESKIYISQKEASELRTNLWLDSLFFKKNGLIDYSLIVFKVVGTGKQIQKEHHIFKSILEPNIYYHIGIVDYLQLWNIDKLLEQKAKQAIHANLKLNVSSQNQDIYSIRFITNVANAYF